MTISAIREVPEELPHARIYLDDLFEIEDILREELSKLPNSVPISFEYTIDGKIVITTREELLNHGGHSTIFSLRIIGASMFGSEGVLTFYGIINPRFYCPYASRDSSWAIFGRIERIFQSRRDRWKNFADTLPVRLSVSVLLTMILIGIIYGLVLWYLPHNAPLRMAILLLLFVLGSLQAMLSTIAIGRFRKNRIYLMQVREKVKAKDTLRRERIEKLIWMIVGAGLGIVCTLVAGKLIR